MGFVFLLFLGLAAIILIARLASKASGRGGPGAAVQNGKERITYEGGKHHAERARYFQEAVISLLLKKGVITEEELLSEVEMIRKEEESK
jgi:hypothetical protein